MALLARMPASGMLASAEEIDRTIREGGPGWRLRAIYQSLKDGDGTSWAILLTVIGLIVLLAVAHRVSRKLMEED